MKQQKVSAFKNPFYLQGSLSLLRDLLVRNI